MSYLQDRVGSFLEYHGFSEAFLNKSSFISIFLRIFKIGIKWGGAAFILAALVIFFFVQNSSENLFKIALFSSLFFGAIFFGIFLLFGIFIGLFFLIKEKRV